MKINQQIHSYPLFVKFKKPNFLKLLSFLFLLICSVCLWRNEGFIFQKNNQQASVGHLHEKGFCQHDVAKNVITEEQLFAGFGPFQQSIMQQLIKQGTLHEQPEVCWHPDTDQEVIDDFYKKNGGMPGNSLIAADGQKYQLAGRWSSTATNGGGLGQGDPTTLTWSFVPDGTGFSNGCGVTGEDDNDPSNLIAFLDTQFGAGPGGADLTMRPWFTHFQKVFDRWEELTGNTYVYEDDDDGADFGGGSVGGVLNVRGDVRIGGHRLDGNSGVLACNYFPSNGDMIFDTDDNFYNSGNTLGFENVISHEHGHGLGFAHSCPTNNTKLMEPYINTGFDGPQEDDILAGNRYYGDPNENNDSSGSAKALGAVSNGNPATETMVSIDDDSESDFYSFSVSGTDDVSVTVTPTGTTYLSGPQSGGCMGTNFDAKSQSDLGVELIDTDGTTVLATADFAAIGFEEVICNQSLSAGTYFVRVFGDANVVQMYDLRVEVGTIICPSCNLIVNEVDYDQGGTDDAEFIELYNPCGQSVDLSTYSIQLINGGDNSTYETINLSGTLTPGDYFVICTNAANTANCDLDVSTNVDLIQDGAPDAIALFDGAMMMDVLSYEGDVSGFVEGSGVGLVDDGSVNDLSLSRLPDGSDTDVNNVDFAMGIITPGAENMPPPSFCAAGATTCDEFIQRVQIGTIDNTTACTSGGYHDYSAQSTVVEIGTPYAITVTNGNLSYPNDQCGIWVDWNQDKDFEDANETISVTGSPGTGPYTAMITPPVGALSGEHIMRIRITWNTTPSPCGTDDWGEVEDYTLNIDPCISQNSRTWTGAVNNDWTNAGNWDCGVPSAANEVIIPNGTPDVVLSSGQTGNCLTIDVQTGGVLTVAEGAVLNVEIP